MSKKMIKLLPKVLSIEHKCKQTKCKQMSEEFENMKKFILYSNQLNIFYLNLINDSESVAIDDKEVFRKERENLFFKIKTEIKTIGETVRQLISGQNNIDVETSKIVCDLCQKRISSKQMSTHLTEHLDTIFERKPVDNTNENFDNINENLNKTNIGTQSKSTESTEENSKLLCPTIDIKDEPLFDANSENGSDWSANMDEMNRYSSDEQSLHSEESIKPPKRRSKRIKGIKSKPKKSLSKVSKKSNNLSENSEPWVKCEECGKAFKCHKFLSIHLGSVHKKYKKIPNECHLCRFKSINNQKFRNHMLDEHSIDPEKEKTLSCTWTRCSLKFYYKTSLQRHISNHSGDFPFKCQWPGCSRQFNRERHLNDHVRVHTGEKPFQCHWPGCERFFRHIGTLRSHMLTHDKSQVLRHGCHYPECGRSYENKKQLRQHIFSVHEKNNKPFRCPREGCESSFVSEQNLRKHMTTIHAEYRVRYECNLKDCKRTFLDARQLERHMEKPHGVNKDLPRNKPVKKYVRHVTNAKCDWPGCDYVCKYSHKIKEHKQRAHTGERPLKCDHPGCDYRAVRKFDVKCHMLKHTGETPFPCSYPHCGRRFKSQRALDTHYGKNHSSN